MLESRIRTAAVLAPLFVLGVLFLPNHLFSVLVGLVVLAGAWEWTHLSGYADPRLKAAAVVAVALLMVVLAYHKEPLGLPLFAAATAAWVAVGASVFRRRHTSPLAWPRAARWISGAVVLVPAWLAVTVLQQARPTAALLLFVLIWTADTGAYFAGRSWGRRRLALAISPGKTLEGVAGAVGAALVAAAVFAWAWGLDPAGWALLGCGTVVVVVLSVVGDLFESNLKRLEDLKDSGSVLPGHGGVLDRIDSMTAAAPFFALIWLWWFESAAA